MEEKKGRILTEEEEKEWREGSVLYEMQQTSGGWKIVRRILENLAFHSWVDPRVVANKEEWEWRELNAYHAANVAKELLEEIGKMIDRADYLQKVRSGEIEVKKFKI